MSLNASTFEQLPDNDSVDFYLTNLFNKLSRRHVSWAWFHASLNVLKTLFIIYSPIDMNTPQHRKHVRYFIRRLFRNIPFAYPCEMWLTRATELKSILAESSSTPSLASKQNFIWIIKLTFFSSLFGFMIWTQKLPGDNLSNLLAANSTLDEWIELSGKAIWWSIKLIIDYQESLSSIYTYLLTPLLSFCHIDLQVFECDLLFAVYASSPYFIQRLPYLCFMLRWGWKDSRVSPTIVAWIFHNGNRSRHWRQWAS